MASISMDCLNTLLMKSVTDNVAADVLAQQHWHAIIEHVEETMPHVLVLVDLLKFTLLGLRHDGQRRRNRVG